MLKVFAIILDIISGIFSLLAPVAVIHWLLGIFEIAAIAPVLEFIGLLFMPLNGIVEAITPFDLPEIDYQDKKIPITQGISAFVLTSFFFVFSFMAHGVRVADKKIELETALANTKKRANEKQALLDTQSKNTISACRLLIYLILPSSTEQNASGFFMTFKDYGGRQVEIPKSPDDAMEPSDRENGILIVFEDALQGLSYGMRAAEKLAVYYASLRPMDPQPPFYMAFHTVEPTNEALVHGLKKSKTILRYAGDNQIVCSQQLLELLKERSKIGNYSYRSLGYYDFESEKSQEIFRLFYDLPEQKVFY